MPYAISFFYVFAGQLLECQHAVKVNAIYYTFTKIPSAVMN